MTVPAMPEDETHLWVGPVPDIGGDPISRAALQEKFATMAQAMAQGRANESYQLQQPRNNLAPTAPGAVQGNLPIPGWTVQNATGSPFRPYTPTMTTPDWTGDPNPIGAGQPDMNQVRTGDPFDRDNIAPIGGAVHEINVVPNPNAPDNDVSGSAGDDLEY